MGDYMLSLHLRKVLEEIIEPGQGDEPRVDIVDPNDPQRVSKKKKDEYKPHAVRIQIMKQSRRKTWMPGPSAGI